MVWPEEAGIGATPASRAKAASERTRPWCDQADDQLCGDDRADARLVEQLWCECPYVGEDLAFELGGFAGCCLDSAGEVAQHEPGRELVGLCMCWSGEAGCSAGAAARPAARAARCVAGRGGHDHAA